MMAAVRTIFALGEVLWDVFPDGPRFGGAPANFACACAELGRQQVNVSLVSAVGNDDLGQQARRRLAEHGVGTTHLTTSDHPTGQVLVALDADGKANYRFIDNPAWDHVTLSPGLLEAVRTADVVCFGTLGQWAETSRNTIRTAVRAASSDSLRILDINLRPPFWTREVILESLPLANVVKLNDEELPIVAELLAVTGSPDEMLRTIAARYSLRLIALTRGANGSVLHSANGERSELPGVRVEVVDTVGAGDAFTAALALGLIYGMQLEVMHRWASDVAAFVCTQPGGTPTMPAELRMANA